MAVISGSKSDVYATSGVSVAFTNLVLTDAGDHKTYSTTDATKRYWDDTLALTVQTSPDGVTWTTVTTGFSIQYIGGKVLFTVANASGTEVRVSSGSYIPYSQIAEGTAWDLTLSTKDADTTVFGATWETSQPLLLGATVKVSRHWADETFFGDLAKRLVLVLYADYSAGSRYEGFANLTGDPTKASVTTLVDEELDFKVTGNLYFSAS